MKRNFPTMTMTRVSNLKRVQSRSNLLRRRRTLLQTKRWEQQLSMAVRLQLMVGTRRKRAKDINERGKFTQWREMVIFLVETKVFIFLIKMKMI